jgi:hypothetical protein
MTLKCSIPRSILPARRIPAVSISSISRFLYFTIARLISRVVPARSATMACCFLARLLNKADLPTFGRPSSAICRRLSSSVSVAFGMLLTRVSSSASMPRVCVVLVLKICLIPRRWKLSASPFLALSILFTTRKTGLQPARFVPEW